MHNDIISCDIVNVHIRNRDKQQGSHSDRNCFPDDPAWNCGHSAEAVVYFYQKTTGEKDG